jgi:hypothetical protein
MNMSEEQKQELRNNLGDQDLCEKLCALSIEDFIKVGEALKLRSLIGKQAIPCDEDLDAVETILDLYLDGGAQWAATMAYMYGKIQGVRAERARKKRG